MTANVVKLGQIATIDISNVDKKSKVGEAEVRLCNFVDVYHNWAITDNISQGFMVATANENQVVRFSVKKGMIAITKDSETRNDIGIPTYIADDLTDVVLGYHCALIKPDETILEGKYLNVVLHTEYAKRYFEANASGSGQRYTLTNEIIAGFPVPLPTIEEQRKIGNLFSTIDKKIENNNAICVDLEGMAKLLYDYWFVQFDFPDENGKPYKSSGGKMVWNEKLKREIPEGWEVIRLGDYITANRGISYNSTTLEENGVPMINLASFNVDSTYKASGLKTYSGAYGEDQVLRPYDLVMCNTQQTAIDPAKDIIGKALLVPDIFDGDIVSSHHVTTIHVADDAFKYYLHAESKTTWFHKYVAGFASGTNILGLDFNGVLNYKMPIPPKEIMSKFANISHSSEARKNEVIRENADLVGLRDFLLPMLMNGQVKVKGA